jgi:hypothetical protein
MHHISYKDLDEIILLGLRLRIGRDENAVQPKNAF